MLDSLRQIDLLNPLEDHDLNRGLVSWWLPLDGLSGSNTLYDLANRNNGTLTNGPTWTTGQDGFGALRFDGTNDRVILGASPTLGTVHSIVIRANMTSGDGVFFGGPVFTYAPYIDATNIYYRVSSTSGIPLVAHGGKSGWITWGISRSGTSVTFYRNGVSLGGGTLSSNQAMDSLLWLGSYTDGSAPWGGQVESVRIHDRTLDAGEQWAAHDQTLRGHPDTLRRYSTARWFVGSAGGGTSYPLALAAVTRNLTLPSAAAQAARYTALAATTRNITATATTTLASRAAALATVTRNIATTNATARASRAAALAAVTRDITPTAATVRASRAAALAAVTRTLTPTAAALARARGMALAAVSRGITTPDAGVARHRTLPLAAVTRALTPTAATTLASRAAALAVVSRIMSRPGVTLTSDAAGGDGYLYYIYNTLTR